MHTLSHPARSSAPATHDRAAALADPGRVVALVGVVLPLLLIGILKFTQIEIDALKPIIGGTPWLAWLYPVLGEAGASCLLGTVEIVTAAPATAHRHEALAEGYGTAEVMLLTATHEHAVRRRPYELVADLRSSGLVRMLLSSAGAQSSCPRMQFKV